MPQYCEDLLQILQDEYSEVSYYTEIDGEYSTTDCFIIGEYYIKLNRIDVDILSKNDIQTLLLEVEDILRELKKRWEKYSA